MDASEILQTKKRNTAFKLRIADLNRGEVISNGKFNFIEVDGKNISRVNVIANVIDKFLSEGEKKYAALTIDDASSQIRIKTFGEDIEKMQNIEIGDTVIVIGAVRFFNNEIYILPEIIRKIEPEWLMVRKLEIEKNIPVGNRISKQLRNVSMTAEQEKVVSSIAFNNPVEIKEEKIIDSSKSPPREKILEMLKQNDEGVDIDKIILSINIPVEEINKIVAEMLENAEIYEPKPGKIRLL